MFDKDKKQSEKNSNDSMDSLTNCYFSAIHAGDLSALSDLIDEGAVIDMTDTSGHSGLYYAIWGNDRDLTEYFLKHQVNRTQNDPSGASALHWAVQAGACEIVRLLLDYSFDIESRDQWGRTALWYAVSAANDPITALLLAEYADPDVCDITGDPLLYHAAETSTKAIFETLIANGANPDQKAPGNRTLLHGAVQNKNKNNSLEIVSFLLETFGSSLQTRDDFGQSPIDTAAFHGNLPMVQYLIARKNMADFNTVRNAMAGGSDDLVLALLDLGIELNLREEGTCRTFLHYAVKESPLKLIRQLIERGINPNLTDCYGEPPLFYALSKKDFRVFRYLLDIGADPTIANEDGQTVLHRVCAIGDLKTTRYLIEKKNMDPLQKDHDGRSAIDLAKSHGDFDLIVYFSQH